MPKLTATLTGVPSALKKANLLASALDRMGRPMFGEIGQYMVMSAKRNFSEQRSPGGSRWRKLSKRTIKEKGHARILFKTGAMNRGIQIVSLEKDMVSVGLTGSETKKGLTHQFGREQIDNITFHIPAHKRKAHTRKVGGRRIKVKAHNVKGHERQRKAHTRKVGGRRIKVKAHNVKAHERQGSLPPIPARPFLGFSKPRKDIKKIGEIISRQLREYAQQVTGGK